MWIEEVSNYGKEVTFGTTGSLAPVLTEAVEYAVKWNFNIDGVSTHMGNTYDETLVSVTYTD